MRFKKENIVINGARVFYWEEHRGRGTPMIFLHGFPGRHKGLAGVAKNFRGRRLLIPDLPACGASEPLKTAHSLESYAQWLNDFLTALSIKRAIIVGHSFGARVALRFSIDHPRKVERLVLIAPVMKVDSFVGKLAALHYRVGDILPGILQNAWTKNAFYRNIGNAIIYKSSNRVRREYLIRVDAKDAKDVNGRVAIEVFIDFYKHPSIAGNRKINSKALLIASDGDEIATLGSVRTLYKRFINADMKVIKNAGHLVVMERPVTVGTIVRAWLK
jgi:pimeloyl-ACP methyl ester carboxylesterase